MQLDTLLLSYQVLYLMVTHIPSDSFVRKDNLVAISLFFFSFIPSSSSFLFLSFYYHPSSASREFMCGTRPYTLPVLHFFFFFFFRSLTFTIFPCWETSAGSNVFRVRGPWVRLINTKRPDRLVLSRRRLSPRLFSPFSRSFSLLQDCEKSRMIILVSIFIVRLALRNISLLLCVKFQIYFN